MDDTTTATPVFNPLSPEFIRDPYPYYRRLRDYDPLWPSPFGYRLAMLLQKREEAGAHSS